VGSVGFVRFRAVLVNRRGFKPGVFALVEGLNADGLLTPPETEFRQTMNDWYDDHLPDPAVHVPDVYDRALHPSAMAWFKATAHPFLTPIPGYLRILEAHGTRYEMICTIVPGVVLYEDPYQVIAKPPPLSSRPAMTSSPQTACTACRHPCPGSPTVVLRSPYA